MLVEHLKKAGHDVKDLGTAPGTTVDYPAAQHRIYDDRGLARLLDPDGVPVAELGEDPDGGRAIAYDRSSMPLAWAKRAGILDERRVVYQRDGTVSNYVVGVQRGVKEAFSASITQMLGRALWIVLLGVAIMLFIPELPLRSREPAPAG